VPGQERSKVLRELFVKQNAHGPGAIDEPAPMRRAPARASR
jgi:hypothetical protein